MDKYRSNFLKKLYFWDMGTPLNVTLSDDSAESTQIKEFILQACRRRDGVSRFPNLLEAYPSNIEVKFVIPKASNTATMSKPRAESDNTFMTILPPGAVIPVRVVRKKKDGREGHPHAIATDLIPAKMTFSDHGKSSLLLLNPSVEREVKKWISLNLKVNETDTIEFYIYVNVCYLTIVLVGLRGATQRMVEPKYHTHTGRFLIPPESVMPCSYEYDFQSKTPFQIRIEDANCISWAQSKIRPNSSLNTRPQSGDLWFLMSPRKNFALMQTTPLQAVWEFSNVQNHLTITFKKDSISKLKTRFMDYNKTSDNHLPLFKFDIMWQGDYEAQRGLPPLHRPLFSFISQQLNVRGESSKPVTQKKKDDDRETKASWPKENKRNSRKSDDDRDDDMETSTEDESEVESGEESEKNDRNTQTEIHKDPSQKIDTSSLLDQEFLNAYLNYRDILMRLFNYRPDSKTWANLLAVEKAIDSRNDVYDLISEIIKSHYPEDQQSIMKPNIIKPYADRLKNIMNAKKAWHKWSKQSSA